MSVEQPSQPVLRGLFGSASRDELNPLQIAGSTVVIVLGLFSVQPRGWTGWGLVTMVLVVVNCLLLATRHLSKSLIPLQLRMILLWSGAVAAALLVAAADHGTPYLFAFFVAGHAGYRLSTNRAVPIAIACSVLSAGVLLLHIGPGHSHTPALVGALSGLSVLFGMVSRSRQDALDSALDAARSAERAAAAESREAVLAERGRIARDVHDVLAHSLAGINMQLEVADALLDTGDIDRVRQATQRAQSLVRESLVESQRTVQALREDVLPLLATLRSMVTAASHSASAELTVHGEERDIPTRVTQALVRIAQEALTNASKHAPAAPMFVSVSYEPAVVVLEVVNDRSTADRVDSGGSGMGLLGMRERAALLHGSVTAGPITEGPNLGGWRVKAIMSG